ncbi:tetratricopeptide repeat protein [Geoalkalibacter halelectricus]|uniref:Tetratricopeptide repeat-containing protein n=1 Tax=Geoalkalibacter halelectricus TaxID=2847045 RepID=A0ABY5ZP65_9BACT|nr:tetratricopeptide repeat protein [Geoalkalibacter halelectricus]MDO3377057.1 hypothetical protein [Geoalkalibacter halelectricus]UWZ79489.1 hypothetical protein L9S41_17670 [Geoalkalibacter halelectricus]
MKKWLAVIFLAGMLAGCSDRAAEMYETAQFEELQRNIPRAVKIYQDIVEKHPNSPQADKARARLAELADSGDSPR